MSLISLPGLKVIAGCEQIETGLFGAPSELSELELSLEGDESSAWATPLANPTATQVDSKKAATTNRNHQ